MQTVGEAPGLGHLGFAVDLLTHSAQTYPVFPRLLSEFHHLHKELEKVKLKRQHDQDCQLCSQIPALLIFSLNKQPNSI